MTQAPLLEYLAAHERLMDWWEGFLADCAKRRAARENTLSARALKGEATKHCNRMKAFRGEMN